MFGVRYSNKIVFPHWSRVVVASPLSATVPLTVAEVAVTSVAACVETVGLAVVTFAVAAMAGLTPAAIMMAVTAAITLARRNWAGKKAPGWPRTTAAKRWDAL